MSLVVSITGASGTVYGIRLLEVLREKSIGTDLVITETAKKILNRETRRLVEEIEGLATRCYDESDLEAPISSGTYKTLGMVVIPCSMKTLAGIASGFSYNLVIRAAEVTLKERRTLVLVPRETPLNIVHLRNMWYLARIGAVILPPMPAFYNRPKTLNDIIDYTVGRVLDCFSVDHDLYERWGVC